MDTTQLNEAMNSDLFLVEKWLRGNKLSLNVKKTHSMLISSKQKHKILNNQNEFLELRIQGAELKVMQSTKYLGVQVDNTLDWRERTKTISSKVSRPIGFLKHARSLLPEESLRSLYTGIVETHFRYFSPVWGSCGATEINLLHKMQNRAARIVTGSNFDTSGLTLVKQLGWKTICELIDSESNTMVFKSLNNLAPQYLCNLFTRMSQLPSVSLRNTTTDLKLPRKNSKSGQKCFRLEVLSCGMGFQLKVSKQPP